MSREKLRHKSVKCRMQEAIIKLFWSDFPYTEARALMALLSPSILQVHYTLVIHCRHFNTKACWHIAR